MTLTFSLPHRRVWKKPSSSSRVGSRSAPGKNLARIWRSGKRVSRIIAFAARDDLLHVDYIRQNPIHKDLCDRAKEYLYSSAGAGKQQIPLHTALKPFLLTQRKD